MTAAADLPSVRELLREHGLAHAAEEPFENDGWSGAQLTKMRRAGGDRFILKRDSLARDWIARATLDGPVLREAWFAAGPARSLPPPLRAPYLGVGRDGDTFGVLMPDLTGVLFDWSASISTDQLGRVLSGLARMHRYPWRQSGGVGDGPWCPLRERISLICRASLERPGPARDAVAERLLPGWDAWDRFASPAAREIVAGLSVDPQPLMNALEAQPSTLIHGDLKLANVGIEADGTIVVVDWQMVMVAPIAIELGWFLVSNVASLPIPADDVIERYRSTHRHAVSGGEGDDRGVGGSELTEDGVDAAILVGLLLRGWRKGADTEAGVVHASGVSAADDLAWWCERAVEAAARIL